MHDSGRNLRLQDLALIPPVTLLTPIGSELSLLNFFETNRQSFPLNCTIPKLKALQIKPVELKHNMYIYQSTATCRSTKLNGSHTQSTQPNIAE